MASLTRLPRAEKPAGQVLIMSLIISVCFAMLVTVGAACANYASAEEGTLTVATGVAPLNPQDVVGLSGETSELDGKSSETAVVSSSAPSLLAGAALCLLGVMCGLIFTIARALLLRCPRLHGSTQMPVLAVAPGLVARPRVSALSLTQLGLSRT